MEELARLDRWVRLLDRMHNMADMVNGDFGADICAVRNVRGRGNVVVLDGVELAEFGHFDESGLLEAYYVLTGVRESFWCLNKRGVFGSVDVVNAA